MSVAEALKSCMVIFEMIQSRDLVVDDAMVTRPTCGVASIAVSRKDSNMPKPRHVGLGFALLHCVLL